MAWNKVNFGTSAKGSQVLWSVTGTTQCSIAVLRITNLPASLDNKKIGYLGLAQNNQWMGIPGVGNAEWWNYCTCVIWDKGASMYFQFYGRSNPFIGRWTAEWFYSGLDWELWLYY